MITNEKQFRSTRTHIDKLKQSLFALDQNNSEALPAELVDIHRNALISQIEELEEDVALYESLRSGQVTEFKANSLNELPDILIQARIARGMSQKDLGDFLGLKEQQIQRYEAERYRSTSLERLIEISDALGVQIRERAELIGNKNLASLDPTVLQAFPIAEMYKRGWFEDFDGSLAQARKAAGELVPAFLLGSQSRYAMAALHRKSVRSNGQVHEAAIAAWEARVRRLADRDPPNVSFARDHVDSAWIDGLVALSLDDKGPVKVIDYLRDVGISLVIERHLPVTLLY